MTLYFHHIKLDTSFWHYSVRIYIHFSFFSYQTDRELNFDVETAIKVNAYTTELKKLCENGTL